MQRVKFQDFKLSDISPAEYNPRTINKEALEGLNASLQRFGCVEPIIVNTRGDKNVIVGGHQRHKSLTGIHGEDYVVTCVVVDLNEADERLLNITLNNTEIQGDFINGVDEYIDQLKADISQDDYYSLRVNALQAQIGSELNDIEIDIEKDQDNGLRLDYLTFNGNKIPLSDVELETLNNSFKEHVEKFGSSYGFISNLLAIEDDDA